MKTLFTLLATLLITAPAFAREISVKGEEAKALIRGLSEIGAGGKRIVERRVWKVTGVRCSSAVVRGGARYSCDLRDENTGDRIEERSTAKVEPLFHALQDAGVKITNRVGGSEIEEIGTITCVSNPFMRRPPSCSISL
jgi:hypothetical protein